jgi:cytoskeletal protein RodZ
MKKVILLGSAVLFLAAGCNNAAKVANAPSPDQSVGQNTVSNNTNNTTPAAATPAAQASVFADSNLSITVLPGWSAKQSTATTASEAVNITKGNYILYINPLFGHASGIQGGRFSEVANGMPSVDLVMAQVEQPASPTDCSIDAQSSESINSSVSLFNLYTDNTKIHNGCIFPSSGESVWFGSYTSGSATAFGRTTSPDVFNEFAITVAYNTKNVNSLPKKNDPVLNSTLADVVSMLKTLKLK